MLEELPIEILELIAANLASADALRFRQASTKVYTKTNDYCARRFFSSLTTDLSLDELHWLANNLTTNQQLSAAIQTLRIQVKDEAYSLGYDYYWNRRKRDGPLILPCDGFDDLRTLFQPHLINCKTVQIHAKDRQAEIDGPDELLEPADVVQLILLLAAESNLSLEGFDINGPTRSKGSKSLGTHLNAERLSVRTLKDPGVVHMLADLKHLNLILVYCDELASTGWLPTFLGGLRNLTHLNLSLDMAFGELELCTSLLSQIHCPHLTSFQLSSILTVPSVLDRLLVPSLRELRLRSVYLVSDGVGSEHLLWSHYLQSLHTKLPQLSAIELDVLGTRHPPTRGYTQLDLATLDKFNGIHRGELDPIGQWYDCVVPKQDSDAAELDALHIQFILNSISAYTSVANCGVRYRGPEMGRALETFVANAVEELMTSP
jgi:hypothetical protein